MPAFYAHERFGKKVWKQMHGELKETIREHYPQFQIGLQGPDIFFFIDYTVIMKFQNMERICTRFLHIRSFRKQ